MPTYKLIQAQTATGGSTGTITFNAIPQTYTHLVLHTSARTNYSGSRAVQRMTFNNDSTASAYTSFFTFGYDATSAVQSQSTSGAYMEWIYATGNLATTNMFGNTTVMINNYRGTGVKTANTILATENNSTTSWIDGITCGYWNNSAAISRIDLNPEGTTYVDNSYFSLYGIA